MWPLWSLILGWLLTAVTVVGNGLVIYLITTRRNLRTTTNWFVLSLAVADFGVGVAFSSFSLVGGIYKDCVDHVKCTSVSVGLFVVYASVTSLCALTLDRYLAIVKPLRYVTFMTKKRVALLIFAAWSVAFLVFISFIALSITATRRSNEIMKKYAFVFPDLVTVSVCIFLSFTTVQIFLIARKHARQTAAVIKQLNFNHTLYSGRVKDSQEAAASKMVCIVVAVFVSCSLLNIYIRFCEYLGFCSGPSKTLPIFRALLFLTNATVNPIAYAFFKEGMRKELKRLFCTDRLRVVDDFLCQRQVNQVKTTNFPGNLSNAITQMKTLNHYISNSSVHFH